MDGTTAAILGGLVGLLLGAGSFWAVRASEPHDAAAPSTQPGQLPEGVGALLAVLRSSGVVLDAGDRVVNTSPSAVAHGLVRGQDLVHAELRHLARQVRRDGEIREAELDLPRGPLGHGRSFVRARVAPLGVDHVVLLIEDQTHARRVDEVRRDFIANVSHELKTPVGGLSLLAEAVEDAHDDPAAVVRFASRMRAESSRLGRLVQEIIDLSRLQSEEALVSPALVDVSRVAHEALDRTKVAAEAKEIELVDRLSAGLFVYGTEDLLVTAVGNLLTNAVNYSEPGTRIALSTQVVDEFVEIAVSDQGHGIPEDDQERVFERFYRVDAARSRATGGTGLGLAIVKHICENHGGFVTVWSRAGQGSTFTIRLPEADTTSEGGPA